MLMEYLNADWNMIHIKFVALKVIVHVNCKRLIKY